MACGCNNSYYSLPCCCPQAPAGTTTTTTTTLCPDAIPCEEAYKSDCIIYNGPDLACYGIKTGDSVTNIINIIIAQLNPCTTTTTSTTTACVRPSALNTYVLNTSINNVSFNASLDAACDAYNQYAANPSGTNLSGITGQGSSLSYGSVIYNGISTDCTLVPNGYYIIAGQAGVVTMINGVLTTLTTCPTTTTTSTSSTSTTTTANPFGPYVCECISYFVENNSGDTVVIPFTDCITGQPDPDGITLLNGDTSEFCACLDSIPEITGVTIIPNGPCAVPTTSTTTSTSTTTTTAAPTTSTTTTTLEPTTSTTSTTTTTTADPSITTTTSTTTTTTAGPTTTSTTSTTTAGPTTTSTSTTTTTVNPSTTVISIANRDISFGMEILAINDLGTGLLIPLDSGSYPILAEEDRTITLPNGLYDFEIFINNFDNRGSLQLLDSNGTDDCRITDLGTPYLFTDVFIDEAGGTSAANILLIDNGCV